MAEPITIQKLIEASMDSDSLEILVNGDENTQVTTRLGETYPSAKKAINIMFEAGGLPATPFKTKALMTASDLIDGSYAQVTDDDVIDTDGTIGKNNGLYIKETGVWIKSSYDPVNHAEKKVNDEIDKIGLSKNKDHPFSVTDSFDNLAFAVTGDGTVLASKVALDSTDAEINNDDEYAFAVGDKQGNKALAVSYNGEVFAGKLNTKELIVKGDSIVDIVAKLQSNTAKNNGHFEANLNHFEIYGQSLSQGAYSQPIQTLTQRYDSLMFVGGIRPQNPSYIVDDFYADFIPLIESKDAGTYVGYETPCGGATDAVKQLISDENGIDYTEQSYQLLGTACGQGGVSIAQLSTTFLNNNLKPAITNAFNLAQAKGMTYAMPLMGWVQGEQDNKPDGPTIQAYQDALQSLIVLVDTHLKTLNSELTLDGVITTQLCSFKTSGRAEPHIELAIYNASIAENNNVYLACPLYIFDYADGYHLNGVSSKWMGAYIGLVYKRVVVDKERWLPVHPISHVKQGKILEVKFHVPVQPLVFDTEHVSLNTDYGFELVDDSNNKIAISSVQITQGDTLKIITAIPIPAGAKLRYAWTPSAVPNRATGPRGNLRDSQGNDMVFDPKGINKPLHNWAPIFQYEV